MLNETYILSLINPYLNNKRELSEFEFFELFSDLEKQEQYEIIDIMIKNNIDYVDKKEEEIKSLEKVEILKTVIDDKDYHKFMKLTNEELCVMYQQGDRTALTALLEKTKGFVYQMALKIVKEYRQQSLTVEDLYMEGNIGVIEAANRFEIHKGFKFSTYAWHWIRQKMVRKVVDTGYMIRIPVHLFEKMIKVNNCRKRHNNVSVGDLLKYLRTEEELEITLDKLNELIFYAELYMNTSSLNDVIGEDGDTERIEFIPDENMSIEDIVIGDRLKDDLKDVLQTLQEKEQKVLDLRYGLSSGRGMTLEEVGEVFNVTRERIRQIESRALRKIRQTSRSRNLKEYL